MIGTLLAIAVAFVAAWYLVRASIRVALLFLLAATFAFPGTVLLPGSFSGHTTVHRLALALFMLNVFRRVALRELPPSVFRPTPITIALAGWVVLSFVVGVALADPEVSVGFSTFLWIFVIDYAIFFVFIVAAIRAIGDPWWFARAVAAVVVVSAGVAIYEHYAGISVARWLSRMLRGPGYLGVTPLAKRGGEFRVQAGFEFSLAYAWAATCLLPLVVAVAVRARRWILRLAPALVVLSVAWTYTRSAYVGVLAAGILVLLTSGFDRRVLGLVGAGAFLVAVFAIATPALDKTFRSEEQQGSTVIREERFPVVLSKAAESPVAGGGLSSIVGQGITTTDSSFLLSYAEMGVVGVAGLTFLLLATLCFVAPAIRAPPSERLLGGAAFSGIVLGITSGAFLDVFNVSGSARSFWLAAALGIVVGERAGLAWPRPGLARVARRLWIPVLGVVSGLILIAATQTTASTTLRFSTRSPRFEAIASAPADFIGSILLNTTCAIIDSRVAAAGYESSCYDLRTGTGIGDVRIEAPTPAARDRITETVVTVVRRKLRTVRFFRLDLNDRVRATSVATAPLWLGIAGFAVAILTPPLPPARRRRSLRPGPVAIRATG